MNEKYRTAGRLMRLSEDRRWEPVGPGMAEGKSLVLGGSTSIAFAIMTAFHARPGDRIIADESAQELTSRVNGGSLRTALEEHLAQHHPERDPANQIGKQA